jgi:hypothetical protein
MFKLPVCVAAVAVGLLLAPAAHAQPTLSSDAGLVLVAGSDTLSQGAGGVLTRDAASAYIEALEFVLAQIGQPTTFPADSRLQIEQRLADAFPSLPEAVQTSLAEARDILNRYRAQWDTLDLDAKREFAYYVLALAYGEQAAAQAVGVSPTSGTAGEATDTYSPSVDDLMGSVPGSDCWSSAGCSSYEPSTNTYTYED